MDLLKALKKTGLKYDIVQGQKIADNVTIGDIQIDSRLLKPSLNTIFFALEGRDTNGEKFIANAVEKRTKVIVAKKFTTTNHENVVFIASKDPFGLLIELLKIFYYPLPKNIFAVTGTNGKTSVVEFARQIFDLLGMKAASIGTLGLTCDHIIKNGFVDSPLTTPNIIGLYKNLSILKKNDVDHVAIEASSIGLDQKRMAGLKVKSGAFTNFSQDHLDYHADMKDYFAAKTLLFKEILPQDSNVVLNADIPELKKLKKICEKNGHNIVDYGYNADCLKLVKVTEKKGGQEIEILYKGNSYNFVIDINVNFQVFNLMCALGLVIGSHRISKDKIEELLQKCKKLKSATGRMQKVANYNEAQIFVDYAHTPDALEISLQNTRKLNPKRLIILFGCGGDRDHSKRPLMGETSCKNADLVIVTDDNSRTENPTKIRKEILIGCDLKKTIEIDGRRNAIEKSLKMLKKGDIIILAGKGHEKYQSINGEKIDFDEVKIIKNIIKNN